MLHGIALASSSIVAVAVARPPPEGTPVLWFREAPGSPYQVGLSRAAPWVSEAG